MPDLNLNDEDNLEDLPSEEPSQPEGEMTESGEPSRRERGGQGARMVIILVVLAVLAGAVYMVNKLGIVKLWGTSEPEVAQVQESAQEQQQPQEETQPTEDQTAQQADQQAAQQIQAPATQQPAQQKPVETPKIEERRKAENPMKLLDPIKFPKRTRPTQTPTRQQTPAQQPQQVAVAQKQEPPPAQKSTPAQSTQMPAQAMPALPKVDMASLNEMQGNYTVQVYALLDKNNAETVVQRLADAGYPAFLEPIEARQMTWYTVRVGKFPSAADAKKAIEQFAQEIKSHHFIDKIRMAGN